MRKISIKMNKTLTKKAILRFLKEAKVVVFDFDNTIVKLNINWSDVRRELSIYFRENYHYTSKFTPLFVEIEKIGCLLGEKAKKEAIKIVKKYEAQSLQDFQTLKTTELIKALAFSGKILCIFSSNGKFIVENVLSQLHLRHYFDIIVCREDVEHYKPSPDGLLKITVHTGVSKDDIIMIGDGVADAKACRDAGIKMVNVNDIIPLINSMFVAKLQ